MIDKSTHEIRQDEDKTVYKTLDELSDDLPDHSPRFVLLSYPLTLVRSGQLCHHLDGTIHDMVHTLANMPNSHPGGCPSPMSCFTTFPSPATAS